MQLQCSWLALTAVLPSLLSWRAAAAQTLPLPVLTVTAGRWQPKNPAFLANGVIGLRVGRPLRLRGVLLARRPWQEILRQRMRQLRLHRHLAKEGLSVRREVRH